MVEQIILQFADALQACPFVQGVVLGGSRATGTANAASDIDIGVYYEKQGLDIESLNAVAAQLDDAHRPNLICPEGGWGNWVNCGGWLVCGGRPVDLILRDVARVRKCVEQTERGELSAHYQPGHPHAFLNVMYRGELAACKLLYAKEEAFTALKRRAEAYPDRLRSALVAFFLFEAKFSCNLAKKDAPNRDLYYAAGHLFRAISALNQVLFAANRFYCLNEKKATARIEGFPLCPSDYKARAESILSLTPETLDASVRALERLCGEVEALAGRTL